MYNCIKDTIQFDICKVNLILRGKFSQYCTSLGPKSTTPSHPPVREDGEGGSPVENRSSDEVLGKQKVYSA